MKTSTVLLAAAGAVALWLVYKRTLPNSKLAVSKPQAPTASSVASGFGAGLVKGTVDFVSGLFTGVPPPPTSSTSTADVLRDSYTVPDTSFDDPSAYG